MPEQFEGEESYQKSKEEEISESLKEKFLQEKNWVWMPGGWESEKGGYSSIINVDGSTMRIFEERSYDRFGHALNKDDYDSVQIAELEIGPKATEKVEKKWLNDSNKIRALVKAEQYGQWRKVDDGFECTINSDKKEYRIWIKNDRSEERVELMQ